MAKAPARGELVLVHWEAVEAEALAVPLRKDGWRVRVGFGEMRELRAKPPTALVISLRRLPSHGREVADAVWYTKWGRAIPIVFFDGEPAKVAALRVKFPAARFASWAEVPSLLRDLLRGETRAELWQCPRCGSRFTTRNQWHSCGSHDLDGIFAKCEPQVRRLFDRFVKVAEESGPVTVLPQKSRIALQVRMRFAALLPRKNALRGHLVLARRRDSPRFEKVETFSPRNHLHVFRLTSEADLDGEFRGWIAEAYQVGCQDHLR